MPTREREEKVDRVLSLRQPDLRIVLEEVTNTHNASAVVRTCDAAGVLYVDLIYADPVPFPVNEAVSTRAEKWLQLTNWPSTSACLRELKDRGFTIAATHLGPEAVIHTSLDFTRPMAVVFGNESEGISEEALGWADHVVRIPMFGMAQSLNLSVSVGIILYEAVRQRLAAGSYKQNRLASRELKLFRDKWLKRNEE